MHSCVFMIGEADIEGSGSSMQPPLPCHACVHECNISPATPPPPSPVVVKPNRYCKKIVLQLCAPPPPPSFYIYGGSSHNGSGASGRTTRARPASSPQQQHPPLVTQPHRGDRGRVHRIRRSCGEGGSRCAPGVEPPLSASPWPPGAKGCITRKSGRQGVRSAAGHPPSQWGAPGRLPG